MNGNMAFLCVKNCGYVPIHVGIGFMTYIETTTLSKTVLRTTVWKCHIHGIFSLGDMSRPDIEAFIEQASLHHPTIEFTAETFDTETAFLDTFVYKGTRFKEKSILDAKTHLKQTESFLHLHTFHLV